MKISKEQLKGRLKNIAYKNNVDARVLLRQFMMERFLERLSLSGYKEKFVIKGGTLVTAMLGVGLRSTMDVDTTITGFDLDEEDAARIIQEIISIDIDDGATLSINKVETIMDEMEYSGIRIHIDAYYDKVYAPVKIDISTGDIITPGAIEFEYKKILEDDSIKLWSYNIETVLAEKIQTILNRGILNTRMRDFYDVHMLLELYMDNINVDVLKRAFSFTSQKRGTSELLDNSKNIIKLLLSNEEEKTLWERYRKKYKYAENLGYKDVLGSVEKLCFILVQKNN